MTNINDNNIILFVAVVAAVLVIIRLLSSRKKKKLIKVKKPVPVKEKVSGPINVTQSRPDNGKRQAAEKAAREMGEHHVKDISSEAVLIRQVICRQRINVNISVLDTSRLKIQQLCDQAEKLRREIVTHRTDAKHLQRLYHESVQLSNDVHALRSELKKLRDDLYRMGAVDHSIRPIHQQVAALCRSIYATELEYNSRNGILRRFIGNNFGESEKRWNDNIEINALIMKSAG